MSKKITPLSIENVDQFCIVSRIPRAAISSTHINNVKLLDEKLHIEPFLRKIIGDLSDTPHGPMEIVDIFTTHLSINRQTQLSAFINKGKSTARVSNKIIGHQISRLDDISDINVAVLLATGDITDDAKKNFIRTAIRNNAEYLIIDCQDIARLFIAYRFICAEDGGLFVNQKCKSCGEKQPEEIQITFDLSEQYKVSILQSRDVSSGTSRRYAADILVDPHYSNSSVREIVFDTITRLKKENFFASKLAEDALKNEAVKVVFLSVFDDIATTKTYQWICMAVWIDPKLSEQFRPNIMGYEEVYKGVHIQWKKAPLLFSEYSKQEWIEKVEAILEQMYSLYINWEDTLVAYETDKLSSIDFKQYMQLAEYQANNVYSLGDGQKVAPYECQECDDYFQSVLSHFHNIFVPFMEKSVVDRTLENQIWNMKRANKDYINSLEGFKHEWKKLRR